MISSIREKYSYFSKLTELIFFPSCCRLCSSLLDRPNEKIVCRACFESLRPRRTSFCLSCGRFFEGSGEPHLCLKCLQEKPPFSIHRSSGKYSGKLKDIILLYKYKNFRILGKGLAQFVLFVLGNEESLWWDVDFVVAVPLHPKRKRHRGFNQAEIIAKELAGLKKIEFLDRILVKTKNVPPQTLIEAENRDKNVKDAFKIERKEKINGKVVLLVDDVFTTGATLRECSSVLNQAGTKEVRAITVAQA